MILSVKNVSKSFETQCGRLDALKNVSFEIETAGGYCLVIGGENGSGKSLLMSIIAGLEDADSGSVTLTDENGKSIKAGLVFQEAETQILGETAAEDIAFGPKNLGWNKNEVQDAVSSALKKTSLESKADFPARFLSGGEKRRLAVACMLAMQLPVIILDEPYANLDYSGVRQVNNLIKELKADGKTVLILTHEIEKCLALADRFMVLFRGEKVFEGSAEDGLKQNLENWNIKNPLVCYKNASDLVW